LELDEHRNMFAYRSLWELAVCTTEI